MKNNFIKLHKPDNTELYINSQMISAMFQISPNRTSIATMNRIEYIVTDPIEEIFKLIEKSNYFTLVTK